MAGRICGRQWRNLDEVLRICCFAKSVRNTMMWAHYAANHRGVALVFHSAQLRDAATGEFRGLAVEYDARPLGIASLTDAVEKYFRDRDSIPMARLSYARKTREWEHEHEVRFFSKWQTPYLHFRESALMAIVFGAKTPDGIIHKVRYSVADWQEKPTLFRVSMERSVRKLWVEKYHDC